MARRSLLLLAGAAGLLLAVCAALPAASAQQHCPPGCSACEPLTPAEIAAWQAKRAEHKAAKALVAPKGGAAAPHTSGRRLAGHGNHGADAKDWPSGNHGHWNGTHHNGTHHNHTEVKCTACVDSTAYVLTHGRCACADGYGWPAPPADGTRPAGPPTCQKCPAGFVSSHVPDHAAVQVLKKTRNGRKLLHGKFKWGSFCVPATGGH